MSVLDRFGLAGKVAVVTGGAGLYGRQISEALAEAGAETVVASRSLENVERVASSLQGRGLKATAVTYDQSSEESIAGLRGEVQERFGRVDVLVNNAVLRPMADWGSPAADFERSLAVNATGLFLMVRTFGRAMAEAGGGSIVNIGSIQGRVGPDLALYEGLGWGVPPDYFFHKGGLLQLTRYAASLLGPRGVRVNAISPGGFFNDQDSAFVERYNARTFLGRMANETDLKGAVVFLASEASAYITGIDLPVDGGYTAK